MVEYIYLYAGIFVIAAIFVAINGNKVPNILLLLIALLFPIAMFISGGTFSEMIPHLIGGAVAFVAAILGFIFVIKSGGLWKTLAVIALWTPTSMLLTTFVMILIVPAVFIVLAKLVSASAAQRIADFYTAIALATAAGVNLYASTI